MAQAFRHAFEAIAGWSPPGSIREQWAERRYKWVQLGKYPYYIVWTYGAGQSDRVIVRVLHMRRDIEFLMGQTEDWSWLPITPISHWILAVGAAAKARFTRTQSPAFSR